MSTLRDPVGPKSRSVYIRRRIIVLVGFLALVAAIVLIVLKPGSSGGVSDSREVAVPSDLQEIEREAVQATEDPEEAPECRPGQLEVNAATDRESYAPDEEPRLSLSVTNTGEAECVADLGTSAMSFEITSGDDRVWRSEDCQTNAESFPVILSAGQTLETDPIVWDRTRSSAETCDITREPVFGDGSSYHLRVTAAGVNGKGTAQFLLY